MECKFPDTTANGSVSRLYGTIDFSQLELLSLPDAKILRVVLQQRQKIESIKKMSYDLIKETDIKVFG